VLRWHFDRKGINYITKEMHDYRNNTVIIPKSDKPERIKENINIFDFELTEEDINVINQLNKSGTFRICDFVYLFKNPLFD
jgi:diketogulonate reductase-like aldo/keto reductase